MQDEKETAMTPLVHQPHLPISLQGAERDENNRDRVEFARRSTWGEAWIYIHHDHYPEGFARMPEGEVLDYLESELFNWHNPEEWPDHVEVVLPRS